MSLAAFLPLLLLLGLCAAPVWLLWRQPFVRTQDYFVAPRYVPPEVIRNSSIAKGLRLAMFGPFFVLGASGDFWPAIVASVCFGAGVYLIYRLREPVLEFLGSALAADRSITVHEFIAQRHCNDPRVRMFAAGLTLFALTALIAGEAFALAGFLKLVFGHALTVRVLAVGALLLMALYAVPAGHVGTMQAAQLQLGMAFLGLFGSAALLLYFHVSALTPLPPHGMFAVVFASVCCAAMLIYRRSRYVDTSPVDRSGSLGVRLLSIVGKILNPVISIFVVLVIVLAGMEFSFAGFSAMVRDSAAALQTAPSIPVTGLIALALFPLLFALVDATNWQRLAVLERNKEFYRGDTARWLADLRGVLSIQAVESPMLWLFFASFGALAAAALGNPDSIDVMLALLEAIAAGDNAIASAAFALLLVAVAGIALPAMASAFAAGLCTIHYDLPETKTYPGVDGRLFFLTVMVAFIAADMALPVSFTSSTFLALVVALCSPPLAFAPLILARGKVSPGWALLILGAGAASALSGVAGYAATGNDLWLWATVPACLGLSFLLLALARIAQGSRMR